MSRLAVLTATKWEFDAVALIMEHPRMRAIGGLRCLEGRYGENHILLAQTGMGPAAAARAAMSILAAEPTDLILSSGYGCLLREGRVGDVMTATEVAAMPQGAATAGDSPRRCDERFQTRVTQVLRDHGVRLHVGLVVSDVRVAVTADEKRHVARETGAIGLDMESAAIAGVAADRGIPMGVLRVVSDVVDEDLPLDFNRCRGPMGWLRAAWHCLIRPTRVAALMAFRRQVSAATASLTSVCRQFLGRGDLVGAPVAASRSAEC